MKATVLCVALFGALAGLAISGIAADLLAKDKTGIVAGLVALAALCTGLSDYKRRLIVWITDHQICPTLGLLGTVIGFMMTLSGITEDIVASKLAGVDTALVTTAAGMVIHIWLLFVREVTRP